MRNTTRAQTTRHGPRRLAVATSALLALVLAAPAAAQSGSGGSTPQPSALRAAALVRPAIVYLETYWAAWVKDQNGQFFNGGNPYDWSASCTGFVVNPAGYIGTAAHCIDDETRLGGAGMQAIAFAVKEALDNNLYPGVGADELTNFALANWAVEGATPGSKPMREIYVAQGIAVSGLRDQRAATARLLDYFPFLEGDAALLKTELSPLPAVELTANSGVPAVGTDILSIGYPGTVAEATDQQIEPSVKNGQISSIATTFGYTVMEMSAAVSPGMSGGPTVNLLGEVIGINSFKPGGETQPFNFATPVDYLKQVMARNGVENQLGQTDTLFRDGLDAYFKGDYDTAIASFDRVLQRFPTHQQAQEYRQQAVLARDAAPATTVKPTITTTAGGGLIAPAPATTVAKSNDGGGGSSTVLVLVAVLAALVAVGAGVMAFRARKRPGTATAAATAPAALPPAPAATMPPATPAAAPAPAAPAPAGAHTIAEEVKELSKLHDEGVLNDEEFAEAKHQLLTEHHV